MSKREREEVCITIPADCKEITVDVGTYHDDMYRFRVIFHDSAICNGKMILVESGDGVIQSSVHHAAYDGNLDLYDFKFTNVGESNETVHIIIECTKKHNTITIDPRQ